MTGKKNILFSIASAAAERPQGIVEEVVYPAAGGLEVLLNLPDGGPQGAAGDVVIQQGLDGPAGPGHVHDPRSGQAPGAWVGA